MADTTYEVQLRYGIESRGAESGLGVLAARAQEAERSMLSLRGALNTITAVASAAAATLGFYKASDALIGYNARLEQTQITMQQIAAVNLRTGFDQAEAPVARYVSLLREAARLSPGTQQDFFSVGQDILGPTLRAGGGIEQARDLARGVILAKGSTRAEVAGIDVQQALAGGVGKKDRFISALIEGSGSTLEAFNKLLPEQRLRRLLDIFNSPAILQSAERYGRSWEGVTSTLEDNLQQLFGKVGLPLTQAITKELARWNDYFDRYKPELESLATRFASALTQGFKIARETVGYILDHKTELLALGAALALRQAKGGIFDLAGGAATSIETYQRQFAALQKEVSLKTLLGLGGPSGATGGASPGPLTGQQTLSTLYVGTLIASNVSEGGGALPGLPGTEAGAGGGPASRGGGRFATARTVATLGINALAGGLGGVAVAQATGRFAQLSPTLEKVNTVAGFVEGALGALPGPLGLVGTTAGLVHQGLLGLYGFLQRRKQEEEERNKVLAGARDVGGRFTQAQIFDAAERFRESPGNLAALEEVRRRTVPELQESKKYGEFVAEDGQTFDYKRYADALINAGEKAEAAELFAERAAYAFETLARIDPAKLRELFNLPPPEQAEKKRRGELARPTVNITIQRMEVAADDPERVAIGLARLGREALRNPLSARNARPRGF